MHSFTTPLFSAFTILLLFSLINSALSATIAARPGYLPHHRTHHHHHHNHIRPAHINDIKLNKNNGHPSMPSVSSRIFTYGKLADKFLLVNDVYLKDGWQSSLEVANAEAEAEGSGSSSSRTTISISSANAAGPRAQAQAGTAYHNRPYGHDHHQGADAQGATHHIQQHPKTTAQEPSVAVAPSVSGGRGSPSPRPALPHIKGCKTLARVQLEGGLVSRLSSYASTIQESLIRLVNVYLSLLGGELRRTEFSFGEEEFSLLIADYLWT